MPIKATFTGDITDLRRGTQQAREEFRKVGTEAQGAARQLKAVGSSFDGSKLEGAANRIARGVARIGGASRLTDGELTRNSRIITEVLQKYERMGVEAPAHIRRVANELSSAQRGTQSFGAALSAQLSPMNALDSVASRFGITLSQGIGVGAVGAIGALGVGLTAAVSKAVEYGGAINDLAVKTGISAEAIQELQFAAAQNGNTIDQVTGAVSRMSNALVENSDDTRTAIGALGLSVTSLRAMEPDQAFTAIATAIAGIPDPMQRAKVAMDIFGKAGADILPTMVSDLEATRAKARDLGLVMSNEMVQAADDLGDTWDQLQSSGAMLLTRGVSPLIPVLLELARAMQAVSMAGVGSAARVGLDEFGAALERQAAKARDVARGPLGWFLGGPLPAVGNLALGGAGSAIRSIAGVTPEDTRRVLFGAKEAAQGPTRGAAAELAAAGASVSEITAVRDALTRLTAAQRDAIREAKALGFSNKEAAAAAGTTENVVRAFVTMESGAKKATTATNKLREEFEKLTGQQAREDATTLAESLIAFSAEGGKLPSDKIEAVAKQLMAARKAAFEAGEETITFRRALDTLQIPSRRIEGLLPRADTNLLNNISGAARNAILQAQRDTQRAGFTSDIIAGANPFGGRLVGLTQAATVSPSTVALIRQAHNQTRDWRLEVRGVAQAFAQLAQIAGPSLNGVARGVGTAFASVDAANELVTSLAGALPKLGLTTKDARGNTVLTGRGQALGGSIAALSTGAALGGMTTNPILAGGLGAGGGLASGLMVGATGATLGLTAGIGAAAAIYMAWRNRQAEKKALSEQRAQVIASAGGFEKFREAVEDAGFEFDYFLTKFNSNDADVFTEGMNQLNIALAEQNTRATALAKGLGEVARVHGVLSQQQIAQIRDMDPNGQGAEAVLQFAEQQRQAGEQGIVSAAGALAQMASLTQEELEALTAGITDATERQRVIDAELKRRAVDTMNRFGTSVQATASGLFVAFSAAVDEGENALDVLRRLGPAIDTVQNLYKRAGLTPGAGFQQLQFQAGMVSDPQTGPALQLAQGLGQALAAYANTGLLSPELFGELANGIGQAYKQLELLGKGGLEAARLMQPSLQAIWQMVQDNPALRDELDDTTLALLDFAEEAGLIGEDFRPAIDRMIDGINDLIAKLGELFERIGQMPGMPPLMTPEVPGAPGTPDTPTNPNPPPNGGDYTTALALGGIVTRPTRALIGEAGPEAVIPLDPYLRGRAVAAEAMATPVQLVLADGRIVAELAEVYRLEAQRDLGWRRGRG